MQQAYLCPFSLHYQYTKHPLFLFLQQLKTWPLSLMLCSGLQNIYCSFILSSKPLNMLDGTLFVVCFLRKTLFLLVFAIKLVITSVAVIFLRFNFRKNQSLFRFSVLLTTIDFFSLVILTFLDAKYIYWPLLVCWQSRKTQLLPFCKRFNI